MSKKPLYSFENTLSTGIDKVPLNSSIMINDSGSGVPKLIILTDNTNITSSTTINDLLTTYSAQWQPLSYIHPTYDGDDINTLGLSGATTVMNDLNLTLLTDDLGHVTDASYSVNYYEMTPALLGAVSNSGGEVTGGLTVDTLDVSVGNGSAVISINNVASSDYGRLEVGLDLFDFKYGTDGTNYLSAFNINVTTGITNFELVPTVDSTVVLSSNDQLTHKKYVDDEILAAVGSSSSFTYVSKTSAYTATASDYIYADTTAGIFTVTLPASPSIDDIVVIHDSGRTFGTNNITVDRNLSDIMGGSSNYVLDKSAASTYFLYNGSEWIVTEILGKYPLPAPILSGPLTANEDTQVEIVIDNYNSDYTYYVTTSGGGYGYFLGKVAWILPEEIVDTVESMYVYVGYNGMFSNTTTHSITVYNLELVTDTAIQITNFGSVESTTTDTTYI